MSAYRVAPTQPEQAFALGALYIQAARLRETAVPPGYLDAFTDQWLAERSRHPAWIAWTHDGQPCAALTVTRCDPLPCPGTGTAGRAHLDFVFTRPDRRCQGLATSLVAAAVADLQRNGVIEVWCPRPDSVRGVLLKAGFQPAVGQSLVQSLAPPTAESQSYVA